MCFLAVESPFLSSLAFSSSHLLFLWRENSGMQQPFPQQQQLKPASPLLQQSTVLRCWRDVYRRRERWVGRIDAFWSEVDSNVVWGTACWTADVPSPQCKSLFSSAVLLVGPYYLLQTFLPLQNIPFTSSCRQTLTSWAPARSKIISEIRPGALLKVKAAFSLRDSRACRQETQGCCQQLSMAVGVSWACASCAGDLHYVLACKYWFIPVPKLPDYQMMPNHAEMNGSFALEVLHCGLAGRTLASLMVLAHVFVSLPQGRKRQYSSLGFSLLFGAKGGGLAVSKPRSKPIPAPVSN